MVAASSGHPPVSCLSRRILCSLSTPFVTLCEYPYAWNTLDRCCSSLERPSVQTYSPLLLRQDFIVVFSCGWFKWKWLLVYVGLSPLRRCCQVVVILWASTSRKGSRCLLHLHGELDVLTQTIQMFQEDIQMYSSMGPDNEGVIHILKPELWLLSAVISTLCSKSSMRSVDTTEERCEPIAVPSVCSWNWSRTESMWTWGRAPSIRTPVVVTWMSVHTGTHLQSLLDDECRYSFLVHHWDPLDLWDGGLSGGEFLLQFFRNPSLSTFLRATITCF